MSLLTTFARVNLAEAISHIYGSFADRRTGPGNYPDITDEDQESVENALQVIVNLSVKYGFLDPKKYGKE